MLCILYHIFKVCSIFFKLFIDIENVENIVDFYSKVKYKNPETLKLKLWSCEPLKFPVGILYSSRESIDVYRILMHFSVSERTSGIVKYKLCRRVTMWDFHSRDNLMDVSASENTSHFHGINRWFTCDLSQSQIKVAPLLSFSWTMIVKRADVLKGMHFPKRLQLSLQRIRAALNEIWGWEKCNDKPHTCATSGRCIVILISNRMILYLALRIQLFRNLRHAIKTCFLNFYSVFHCYYFFAQIFSCKTYIYY